MLVCNVSLRPQRAGIAATIVEAATATDATATGNIVFATLVDDPASVSETVDAYIGEIMLEAASAAATVDSGLEYVTAVDEAVTATDTSSGGVAVVVPSRSAMVLRAYINAGTSREANAIGTMINQ